MTHKEELDMIGGNRGRKLNPEGTTIIDAVDNELKLWGRKQRS